MYKNMIASNKSITILLLVLRSLTIDHLSAHFTTKR